MRTILVVISKSKETIYDRLGHCIEKHMKHIKDQYIYMLAFPNKDKAREYMCFELIKDDLLRYNERLQKYNKRVNEFNFQGLNISLRTGNEKTHFEQYFSNFSDI